MALAKTFSCYKLKTGKETVTDVTNNRKCLQCGKVSTTKTNLTQHLKTHLENRPKFKCSFGQCTKEYKSTKGLDLHNQKIHLKTFSNFGCSFCPRIFTHQTNLNNHILAIHTLEKAFKCGDCPSRFSSTQQLRRHRRQHLDELHTCPICSKKFNNKEYLNQHTKTVHSTTRSRDFSCLICHKSFFWRGHLSRHTLTHAGDWDKYSFHCYFCKKRFGQRSCLESHMRTHTQEKPFQCSEGDCQYSSSCNGNLSRHTKIRHSPVVGRCKDKMWSCYFCRKMFAHFRSLEMHFGVHTQEEPFKCGLCQKGFERKDKLKDHILTHTMEKPSFKCKECGKYFSRHFLKKHIQTTHRQKKHI